MNLDDLKEVLKSLSIEEKIELLSALDTKHISRQEQSKQQTNIQKDANCIVNTKAETSVTQNKRREPVRGRENRWEDTGEFRDIETPEVERTPRRRASPRKMDVECASCGKSFKVDSRFVYGEYYRCNRCGSKR
jgi:DNA-directed RNA polymerase subunit RPC12/RpoP